MMPRKTKKKIIFPRQSYTFKRKKFLNSVSQAAYDKEKLKHLIGKSSDQDLKAIVEVVQNFLNKNYPSVSKKYRESFIPHKTIIRKLGDPRTSVKKKRTFLLRRVQKGGLPFLLPLLSPIIGSLISAGISSAL